jgi:LacI family transcriptional regulator
MATTSINVAEKAGVSQSTVSLVLSNSPLVAKNTRERVLRVMREEGYRPHAGARAARLRTFHNVAVITVAPYTSTAMTLIDRHDELLDGINHVLIENDCCLSLLQVVRLPTADVAHWPRLLTESRIDGFIATSLAPSELCDFAARYRLPAIWVNSNLNEKSNCIRYDEVAGARSLTRYLIDRGHRRIAFLPSSSGLHYSDVDRFKGYVREMQAAGLPLDRARYEGIEDQEAEGRMLDLLRQPQRPTAIMAVNANRARQLASVLYALRLRVPDDVSTVTWLASPDYPLVPTPTAMIADEEQVGRWAAEMLLAAISQKERLVPSRTLTLRLVEGETVQSVRKTSTR